MTPQTHLRSTFGSLSSTFGPMAGRCVLSLVCMAVLSFLSVSIHAQAVNSSLQGRVQDSSGAIIAGASVTVVNAATGLTRSAVVSVTGDYTVSAQKEGFQKAGKKIHLDLGSSGNLDFTLGLGQVQTQVEVQDVGPVAEPTRSMVSAVIDQQKISDLPVNGREFIDFALLAPGVTIGNTTSGSTDVIV